MRSIPDYFWPANLKRTLRRAAIDPQTGRVGDRLQVAMILAMWRWARNRARGRRAVLSDVCSLVVGIGPQLCLVSEAFARRERKSRDLFVR
jgi:hypothetical protein